ncbi:zinc-binding metallopeptidase family protein [Alicyclobacillus dauci]|uniref:Peptidase M42 n=1 Tax=Alicyclobacillus dauci TaxID=1475485 RepID=A0ABY6YYC5_9BACL|nr:peptidase M42 [Alicyclobacillus dauci]WAH35121.1 peptidase M42 [Alicyclobacillus dauci]
MKELILKLAKEIAPSGSERAFQSQLLAEVQDVADNVHVDTLGNGIARKNGEGPHIMLAAHADEPGVMVVDIDDEGFLRLIAVGNLDPKHLLHRQVAFTNGVRGSIELEEKVKVADATYDHLFVDIGATSKEDALGRVYIGLAGVVVNDVTELGERKLVGRALDNRVGCAVAIQAFRELAAANRNVTLVFTAQSVVGARGARTAAYQIAPDLALIIDAAPASDVPDGKRTSLKLGGGPAVKIMDGTAIVPIDVKDHLIETAKKANLTVQYEVWPGGQSDVGSVQLSVDGIRIGGVSYPARYVGSTQTVVDLQDVEQVLQLTVAAAKTFKQA